MLRRHIWGVAAVVSLLAATPARATDRFVTTVGSDVNPCTSAEPCLTVQRAFNVAAASGDRVLVGPGSFVGHATTTKRVDLIGSGDSGPTMTILSGDDGSPTVRMQGGGSASGLRIRSDQASGLVMDSTAGLTPPLTYAVDQVSFRGPCLACSGTALTIGNLLDARPITATVDRVDIDAGGGSGLTLVNQGTSATVRHVAVAGEKVPNPGISFFAGADGSVADSTVYGLSDNGIRVAGAGGSGPTDPARAIVDLERVRVDVLGTALSVEIGEATATDSLLASRLGLAVFAHALANADGAAAVRLRGSTAYAQGTFGARGLLVNDSSGAKNAASAVLENSIVRAVPAGGGPAAVDIEADHALAHVTATHSSFSSIESASGAPADAIPAPGSGTNVAGDPAFAGVGSGDFSLAAGSPLIDRGDPALVAAGETDLSGAIRSLDGDGDCSAAPDIGAFEAAALACVDRTPPTLSNVSFSPRSFAVAGASASKARGKRGSRLKAKVSEAGSLVVALKRCRNKRCTKTKGAGRLTFTSKAGKNSIAFSGRVGRKALGRGSYRATVRARDRAGNLSRPKVAPFTILSP